MSVDKRILIYKSSAGSGKTHKLAEEYIKLSFRKPDYFKHVLAITFTNKATDEMKSRILEFLIALKKNIRKSENLDLFTNLENIYKNTDVSLRAKETLENILHNYSYFSVSTIDSFYHRLLRSFAKELNIRMGYELEMDSTRIVHIVTENMLDDIAKDKELLKIIENYILTNIDDNKGWNIEKELKNFFQEIFRERYWEKKYALIGDDIYLEKLKISKHIEEIFQLKKLIEKNINEIPERAGKIMETFGLTIDDANGKSRGAVSFLLCIDTNENLKYPSATPIKNYSENKWLKNDSKNVMRIDECKIQHINSEFKTLFEKYILLYKKYKSVVHISKKIYITAMFDDIFKYIQKYRDENRIMLQADLNNILRAVVSDNSAPFIYEKTGVFYKDYLIDEFQDTSLFQYTNMKPLLENSISESNRILLVGDVKQSIYRWRNGDMKIMTDYIHTDFDEYRELFSVNNLNKNYRSNKEIIGFNNLFFDEVRSRLNVNNKYNAQYNEELMKFTEKIYDDTVKQEIVHNDKKGYVRIEFLKNDEEQNSEEKVCERVNDELKNILAEGIPAEDVLILIRDNKKGRMMAEYLGEKGIEVVSQDSMFLDNSPAVKVLVNLLKYVSDRKCVLPKVEVVFHYLNYLEKNKYNSDDYEIFINTVENFSFFKKSMPEDLFKKGSDNELRGDLNSLQLYELTENLIRIFNLDKNYNPFVMKFLEIVFDYSNRYGGDIKSFLDWWDVYGNEQSITTPEMKGKVKIMTIHKSKGLQSRIVILPFANWRLDVDGRLDTMWVPAKRLLKNEAPMYFVSAENGLIETVFEKEFYEESIRTRIDNLNLLYVAFTRAKERLYVFTSEVRNNKDIAGCLIEDTIKNSENLKNILTSAEDKWGNEFFEYGSRKVTEEKKEEVEKEISEMYKYYEKGDWNKKIIIRPVHSNLGIEKDGILRKKLNYGILIHKLLSEIVNKKDIDKALVKLKMKGLILEDDVKGLKEVVKKIIGDKISGKWFEEGYEVLNEAEIIKQKNEVYRPDRILIKDDEVVVIDYKTGKESESHIKQLKNYGELLKEMGYSKVEEYLLYISETPYVKKI